MEKTILGTKQVIGNENNKPNKINNICMDVLVSCSFTIKLVISHPGKNNQYIENQLLLGIR